MGREDNVTWTPVGTECLGHGHLSGRRETEARDGTGDSRAMS